MIAHASARELSLWIDDQLPRSKALAVEEHVNECDSCRQRYLSTLRLIDGLHSMERVAPPSTLGMIVEEHRLRIGNPRLRQRLERSWKRWPDPMLLTYLGVVLALGFMIVMVTRLVDSPPSGTRIYAPSQATSETATPGAAQAEGVWLEPGVSLAEAEAAVPADEERTAEILSRLADVVPPGTRVVIAREGGEVVRVEVGSR